MPRPKIVRRGREFWAALVAEFDGDGANELHQEFADRHGVACDTFRRWLYKLRAEKRGRRWRARRGKRAAAAAPISLPLLEVSAARVVDERFEIDLGGGRCLRVPAAFDADALRRLLAIFDEGATR